MGIFDITPDPYAPEAQAVPEQGSYPSYLRSADLHNIGNQGETWFESVGTSLKNAPDFLTASILSGINSFYNTGAKVAHWFGADVQERNTEEWITSMDSNLGDYYSQNKDSVDLAGFLITSMVPGTLGVKALQAGQKALQVAANSGKIGSNMSFALGLRAAKVDSYISAAAADIAKGQAAFTSLGANGVKALSAGVYQNVLEGVAFETMVQATMQASPVLDGQSKGDVLFNIATGGLLGGAIGGAFHSASTLGKIHKAVDEVTAKIRGTASRSLKQETGRAADDIIFLSKDLEHGPTLDPGSATYTAEAAALEKRQQTINLEIRKKTHELVPGEQTWLGNRIADLNYGEASEEVLRRMDSTHQITGLAGTTRVEKAIEEAKKAGLPDDPKLQVHFVKITGEGTGEVITGLERPGVYNLADTFLESKGSSIRDQVLAKVRSYKNKVTDAWTPQGTSLLSDQGHLAAEGRYIWAKHVMEPLKDKATVGKFDFPVLQRALDDNQLSVVIKDAKGRTVIDGFNSADELKAYIVQSKRLVAEQMLKKLGKKDVGEWGTAKIAKILDMELGTLERTSLREGSEGFFASKMAKQDYDSLLKEKNLKPYEGQELDSAFHPTWAKVTKVIDDTRFNEDGTVIDAMTHHQMMMDVARAATNNVAAKVFGELHAQLPTLGAEKMATASAYGTGARMLSFSNPAHGTLGSDVAMIGSVVSRAEAKAIKEFSTNVEGAAVALGKNQEAVIEWNSLHQKVSRLPGHFAPEELVDGVRGLVNAEALKAAESSGKLLTKEFLDEWAKTAKTEAFIPIKTTEAWNITKLHVEQDSAISSVRNELASAVGKEQSRMLGVFRPIRPDLKDHKHFAFVKDPKVTGQGHTSVIFAENEAKLKQLVEKAQGARPDLEIHYKKDTKEYFEAYNTYQYDRTLSENYVDGALKKEGILSDYFTKTDPQRTVDEFVNHHTKQIGLNIKEVARAKYQPEFSWLEQQASEYSKAGTSTFGGSIQAIEQSSKNPYLSYIKTALNLSRANENALWYTANKAADSAVSNVVGKVQEIWGSLKTSSKGFEAQVEETNKLLQKYGMNTGYMDAATQLLVNEKVPQGELTKAIRSANALLGRLTLGMDPMNAAVNAISSNILRATELKHMLRAVKEKDPAIAGKLTELMELDVTGKGDLALSPQKLIAKAYKAYAELKLPGANQEMIEDFRKAGFIRDLTDQFHTGIDLLTWTGKESSIELKDRIGKFKEIADKLGEKAEKWSGNKHAEEMNRFTTAHTMWQMTQPLVETGRLSKAEQYAYINTHVNRVEGNVIASQRPFVFQGPIGQAVGMFQSYQFNLMQQMFRYVAEGGKKDAAMLLGLQGTFFGIQGLPAFQAINQHIIGTASGNRNHVDAYDATYGIAGKQIGDMLLYGLPSNLLQSNLYSRGDINPRHLTILPTALSEVPAVGAYMKFLGSMKETFSKVADGGAVWESFLQGVEHNGISRPLAGMAQVLQATTGSGHVMSTTNKGNIMFQNDFVSMATLTRLAGARPLDEAVISDSVYRVHSYAEADRKKMKNLAEAVRTQAIGGQQIEADSWEKFAQRYAEAGGRQTNFNKFMMNTIKSADTNEAERITQNLKSPLSQKVQLLMGGNEFNF